MVIYDQFKLTFTLAFEQIVKETKGKYCVGNEVTFADVLLIPQLYGADRFEVDLKEFPNL